MAFVINRNTLIKERLVREAPPGGMKVVHKDVFSMEAVYTYTHDWFVENGWASNKDDEWPEVIYVQRESANGIELFIKWRLKKKGKDRMFEWEIDMNWHIMGMKEVEATVKGKKLKMNTAETEIELASRVMKSPDFAKDDFFKRFEFFLLKRFLIKKVEKEEDDLYDEAVKFQEALKGYFRLETYLPEPAFERFYPSRTGEEPR